jgi:hypothetical protein
LSEFYAFDANFKDEPDYIKLADIYDELAEIFGKKSDFEVDDKELD